MKTQIEIREEKRISMFNAMIQANKKRIPLQKRKITEYKKKKTSDPVFYDEMIRFYQKQILDVQYIIKTCEKLIEFSRFLIEQDIEGRKMEWVPKKATA